MRHNFSPDTKEVLAQRSGYMCSFPGCGRATVGPNLACTDQSASVGMACHIYCATPGLKAKRLHPNPSDESLSDISNGIWMCYTHGKLIDTDDRRFTADHLKAWRSTNEAVAALMRDSGIDYSTAYKTARSGKLIESKVELPAEIAVNIQVGDAIHDSCLPYVWGQDLAESVRDYVIEHVRNSYRHGDATKSNLIISAQELIVVDDGRPFHPRSLQRHPNGRGGALAFKHLLKTYGERICLLSISEAGENTLTISLPSSSDAIKSLTPCVVPIVMKVLHEGNIFYTLKESCQEVVFILPNYFALSDIALLSDKHPQIANETRHVVFVLSQTSAHVRGILRKQFPAAQLLTIDSRDTDQVTPD